MTAVLEHFLIDRLAAALPRTPRQLNRIHESDAELVRLPGTDLILAVTTDALAEEIATGLYGDPAHIGWMLVMANASDLAAVGAEPLGLLLCESMPSGVAPAWVDALQRGIADAAVTVGLPILGGDTNTTAEVHLAATALGIVRGAPPLMRAGARAGDTLYTSGLLGAGGAFALARFVSDAAPAPFRPVARLTEGRLLRGKATACMDTSDGAIATLDALMTRSAVGFRLDTPLERWTEPRAARAARAAGLQPWMLHAGPHGEFELLFTVPPEREAEVQAAAADIGWRPTRLGVAVREPELTMVFDGHPSTIDARRVRNLYARCGNDVRAYLAGLDACAAAMSAERPGRG